MPWRPNESLVLLEQELVNCRIKFQTLRLHFRLQLVELRPKKTAEERLMPETEVPSDSRW